MMVAMKDDGDDFRIIKSRPLSTLQCCLRTIREVSCLSKSTMSSIEGRRYHDRRIS